MRRIIAFFIVCLYTAAAAAQYPSPTFNNLTWVGTATGKYAVNASSYIATTSYAGTTTSAAMLGVLGSSGTPDTTNNALVIFQKWGGSATPATNPAAYFSAYKTSSADNIRSQAIYAEVQDQVGWSPGTANNFVEAIRGQATAKPTATLASLYGVIGSAGDNGASTHKYIVAVEGSTGNFAANASAGPAWSPSAFVASFVASSYGNKTGDAWYTVGPYPPTGTTANYGFFVPESAGGTGIAAHTVSWAAFKSNAASNYGLDLTQATNTFGIALANNITAVGALNFAGSTVISLLGTDTSNNLLLGSDANVNHISLGTTNTPVFTFGPLTFANLTNTPTGKQPLCIDTSTGVIYKGVANAC